MVILDKLDYYFVGKVEVGCSLHMVASTLTIVDAVVSIFVCNNSYLPIVWIEDFTIVGE